MDLDDDMKNTQTEKDRKLRRTGHKLLLRETDPNRNEAELKQDILNILNDDDTVTSEERRKHFIADRWPDIRFNNRVTLIFESKTARDSLLRVRRVTTGNIQSTCEEYKPKTDRTRVCWNCDEVGHIARDCPHNKMCRNCKSEDHLLAKCDRPVTCHICHEEGHKKSECNSEEKKAWKQKRAKQMENLREAQARAREKTGSQRNAWSNRRKPAHPNDPEENSPCIRQLKDDLAAAKRQAEKMASHMANMQAEIENLRERMTKAEGLAAAERDRPHDGEGRSGHGRSRKRRRDDSERGSAADRAASAPPYNRKGRNGQKQPAKKDKTSGEEHGRAMPPPPSRRGRQHQWRTVSRSVSTSPPKSKAATPVRLAKSSICKAAAATLLASIPTPPPKTPTNSSRGMQAMEIAREKNEKDQTGTEKAV